jgi:hypothetical protein
MPSKAKSKPVGHRDKIFRIDGDFGVSFPIVRCQCAHFHSGESVDTDANLRLAAQHEFEGPEGTAKFGLDNSQKLRVIALRHLTFGLD